MDKRKAAIGEFLQLGANAFASGLAAAVALAVITLALASATQAASLNDAKTGTLMLRTATAGEYVVAPKVETEVAIEVTGMIARTRLSQVFHNPGSEFVEGVYVFPLPEKAAVDHLWMRIGERVIEGQVKEKEEARRTYDKARSEGRKAALVEQQRPNLFTNAVAHIGPNENVRDFELKWSVAPDAAPQAAVFTQDVAGTAYALIMVVPPEPNAAEKAAVQRVPRETILIVDTSGSMAGASMEQAKAAVNHALSTLTERDRFNVLEFNSVMHPLFVAALPATPQNLANAKAWVAKLKAGGGTEMVPALEFALDGRETPGYLRQVVFMTDGGVSNEDELFKLIEQRLGNSRLFTVGIGPAPNGHFMTVAAQFGRGTFTQIGDVHEVEEKMRALFVKIEAPVLRDVAIRWADGSAVETFPRRVPDLYLGEPIVVSASAAHFAQAITVSGTRGNQPWSVALTPSRDGDANGVGALWARARIASLMDEMTRGADPTSIRPQVVKVALEHHLVSAYTSLVAVDVSVSNPSGALKTALVKASPPQGWSGEIPQTDTSATLQLLLGLIALASAGIVAAVGRAVPARRAA